MRIARFVLTLTTLLAGLFGVPRAMTDAEGGPQLVRQGTGVQHPLFVHDALPLDVTGGDAQTQAVQLSAFWPDLMRSYLGLTGNGEGETIAIVTAFHHPALLADLVEFSSLFDLPLVCGEPFVDPNDCINVNVVVDPDTPVDEAWALETALDVQWAHAIAPRADLIVVEAPSDDLRSMMLAVRTASRSGASVVSGSWGEAEDPAQRKYDGYCVAPVVCVFATGNDGQPAAYPAISKRSIAVGGTSIRLDNDGNVISEDGWSGSGGGLSEWRTRPAYQRDVNAYERRGSPDVSYNADPQRPYVVYDSVGYQGASGLFALGGTSAAAPQWAAIIAVANQLRVAEGKPRLSTLGLKTGRALYSLAGSPALYDVTTGSNGDCDVCNAEPGYDFVTGLGSPRKGIDVALAATP